MAEEGIRKSPRLQALSKPVVPNLKQAEHLKATRGKAKAKSDSKETIPPAEIPDDTQASTKRKERGKTAEKEPLLAKAETRAAPSKPTKRNVLETAEKGETKLAGLDKAKKKPKTQVSAEAALKETAKTDTKAIVLSDVQTHLTKSSSSEEDRPFARLISKAIRSRQESLTVLSDLTDGSKVPINQSMRIESQGNKPLSSVLKLPGIVIVGPETRVIFKNLTLEVGKASVPTESKTSEALIDVRQGASLELIDCRLRGGGLKLGSGTSAKLVRTRIADAKGAGIEGSDFSELSMDRCEVVSSSGEGIRAFSSKRVALSDCTIADNDLNGLLIGSVGSGLVQGCTICRNGQYGVFADTGTRVQWTHNSLLGNSLGETSGRGLLEGYSSGSSFSEGDPCLVWFEEKGFWLPGIISKTASESSSVVVRAELPRKGLPVVAGPLSTVPGAPVRRLWGKTKDSSCKGAAKTVEVTVSLDAVRQPRSGDLAPPTWSNKAASFHRKNSALEFFLQSGGANEAAWQALDAKERARFQSKAKRHSGGLKARSQSSTASPGQTLQGEARRKRLVKALSKSFLSGPAARRKRLKVLKQ